MVEPLQEDDEFSGRPSGVWPRDEKDHLRIVVVGHGMVGQRVCEQLRVRESLRDAEICVFGEEPSLPYDRVHLARVVRGESERKLQLVPSSWYEENNIKVFPGDPVVQLDRESRLVTCRSGRTQVYDHLVLATGAAPVLGKIPGIFGRDVCALRSVEDARIIREKAYGARVNQLPVVIIGAGLLGIELASELKQQDTSTIVLESADYPLSRQLNRSAGKLLLEHILGAGLSVQLGVRVLSVEERDAFSLVHIEGKDSIRAGLVVPAMGIRPRDQLARDAGLHCDLFGGVEVNDELLTSDANISAVGECARHRGMNYGLVAPGYAMADAVARRLSGARANFKGIQVGTRLKVPQVDLTVVGQSAATGFGLREQVYSDESAYRRIALRRGRVIGITAIGGWKELPRVEEAMARAERLKRVQLKRFERAEPMWPEDKISLHRWPDSATVCNCMGVTCGALRKAKSEGCEDVQALADATGASTVCGSCRPLLSTLVEAEPEAPRGDSPWLLSASVVAVLGAMGFLLAPPIPYSGTVQEGNIDVLWRTRWLKELTGFSLAGLFALSVLFSLRKRIKVLRLGDFESWRVTHALIGVLCLVGGALHTGFRLGKQLDLALAITFLASVFLGGAAGGWSLIEHRLSPERARALRGTLIRTHVHFLWPLPVLLVVHVFKVYFF